MSRFLLLVLFLIWMAWRADGAGATGVVRIDLNDIALFFGLYLLIIGVLAVWSRLLTRRLQRVRLERGLRYFHRVMFAARTFVPAWYAVGVFSLGWGWLVQWMLGPVADWPVQVPGAVIGVLPPLLAWAGLWWAQYPADRALRQQRMLLDFDNGHAVFQPPRLWDYLASHLRLQVLFTAVPILLILALHDAVMLLLWRGFDLNVERSSMEGLVTFASALTVFLVVPEVLVRVLPTHVLPQSPLRDRMESMCRAHGLKFRDILIWRTEHRIANALVMGVLPRFRYVLLSDLLLSEMTDEQIEAVFAHELGHVVHRHMIWYLVFLKVLILILALVAVAIEAQQRYLNLPAWVSLDLVMTLIGFVGFVVAFGYVSRRFERQADVFAARTLQRHLSPLLAGVSGHAVDPEPAADAMSQSPASASARQEASHVGPLGASIFASALERVAHINDMPLGPRSRWEGGPLRRLGYVIEHVADAANNWLHGSIAHRMRTLHRMSVDPAHTHRFDRRMARLYIGLLLALLVSGTIAWLIRAPL